MPSLHRAADTYLTCDTLVHTVCAPVDAVEGLVQVPGRAACVQAGRVGIGGSGPARWL